MKKLMAAIGLVLISFGIQANDGKPDANADIADEVQQAFEGLAAAARTLDHNAYFSFFDVERFTSLNEDGTVYTSFAEFERNTRPALEFIAAYNSLVFSNVQVTIVSPQTAVLVNEYAAEVVLTSGDTASAGGAGTQVWSKNTGEWKLVHVSSSSKN